MKTRELFLSISVAIIILLASACSKNSNGSNTNEEKVFNVLIFSKTNAFRHECIEPGGVALKEYFEANGIHATQSEDSSLFNNNQLSTYDVVIFFQTTGNILDSVQQETLVKYVKSGKGFVGIHAAADTEYDWSWYAGLIGAQFASHPDIQQATVVKVDTQHLACRHLPVRWTRTDEWYNFRTAPQNVKVLLTIDEGTYQGGTHGTHHPISWYQEYDGGRSFYTAAGHTVESYQDTLFLRHIAEGVKWAGSK